MNPFERCAINIATWNSHRYLPELFASLRGQTTHECSVTIVDNASHDGTLEWLAEEASEVPVLKNYRNHGFARAHNQAIALALSRWADSNDSLEHRYLFVLNHDCILDTDCMAHLLEFMDTHPTVAIAGPKLLRAERTHEDGDTMVHRTNIIDSTGLVLRKNRQAIDRGAGEEDSGVYDSVEPFGISGAAMMIRASVVPELKLQDELFDDDFESYKEDVDLAWRARLFGKRIAFVPEAIAWHDRGLKSDSHRGVFDVARDARRRPHHLNMLSQRNQTWVEWKNDDMANRALHAPWILCRNVLRFGSIPLIPGTARAVIESWLGRNRMMNKRREIQSRRVLQPREMRAYFV